MVRCSAICSSGNRCRKKTSNGLCGIHENKPCEICEQKTTIQTSLILDCKHTFCKKCITESVYKKQWYVEFSTDDPIKCPICSVEVDDYFWEKIMDLVVERFNLKRQIIYDTYLSHDIYSIIYKELKLGKIYKAKELDAIHTHYMKNTTKLVHYQYYVPMNTTRIDIVYFPKSKFIGEVERLYRFFFGDPDLREKFHEIEKELIEYCWHPSRIKNIEDLDNM